MTVHEIKSYLGKSIEVEYRDRLGNHTTTKGKLEHIEYQPLYGSTLVFDFGKIGLDKIEWVKEGKRLFS